MNSEPSACCCYCRAVSHDYRYSEFPKLEEPHEHRDYQHYSRDMNKDSYDERYYDDDSKDDGITNYSRHRENHQRCSKGRFGNHCRYDKNFCLDTHQIPDRPEHFVNSRQDDYYKDKNREYYRKENDFHDSKYKTKNDHADEHNYRDERKESRNVQYHGGEKYRDYNNEKQKKYEKSLNTDEFGNDRGNCRDYNNQGHKRDRYRSNDQKNHQIRSHENYNSKRQYVGKTIITKKPRKRAVVKAEK